MWIFVLETQTQKMAIFGIKKGYGRDKGDESYYDLEKG